MQPIVPIPTQPAQVGATPAPEAAGGAFCAPFLVGEVFGDALKAAAPPSIQTTLPQELIAPVVRKIDAAQPVDAQEPLQVVDIGIQISPIRPAPMPVQLPPPSAPPSAPPPVAPRLTGGLMGSMVPEVFSAPMAPALQPLPASPELPASLKTVDQQPVVAKMPVFGPPTPVSVQGPAPVPTPSPTLGRSQESTPSRSLSAGVVVAKAKPTQQPMPLQQAREIPSAQAVMPRQPVQRTVAVVRAEVVNAVVAASREATKAASSRTIPTPVAPPRPLIQQTSAPTQPVVTTAESSAASPLPAVVIATSLQPTAHVLPSSGAEHAPLVSVEQAESTPRTLPSVARGLSTLASQRGGSLQMRLDPPSLGTIRLEMTVEAGRVAVHMVAASDSARGLLSGNLDMLRTSLEERGLAVDRLAVELGSRSANESTRSDAEQQAREGRENNARQDASQGRSRGHREARQQGFGSKGDSQQSHDFEEHLERA